MVLGFGVSLHVLLDAATAHLLDFLHSVQVNAVLVVHIAVGVGAGHDLGAEGLGLFDGIGGHVAGAGDYQHLVLQVDALGIQHILHEVEEAIARSLGTSQAAPVIHALAGEDTCIIGIPDALVLAEEIANFAAAYADIACRYIHIRADMAVKLSHEALAEAHDLCIALAMGVKVGAALGAANGQAREGILVNLFESKEFKDIQVYAGMEAQAAFVGADGRGHLHTEAAVDLNLAFIISPGHAEGDDALRLYHALKDFVCLVFGMLGEHRFNGFQHLACGVEELGLVGVTLYHQIQNFFDVRFAVCHLDRSFACGLLPFS